MNKRSASEATVTGIFFVCGIVCVAIRFGLLVGFTVFFLGFALIGELQRKANDIIELSREP